MRPEQVRWLQIENTTRCNAWCPSCIRNQEGYGLRPGFVETDLALDRMAQVLGLFPNLETIQFCGNGGDSLASALSWEHIALAKTHAKKLMIHTNGSLRSEVWWQDLAKSLEHVDHEVWFTLDGLAGTHEIYRQGTDWQRIIDNAQVFIDAGGHAVWQFIPFQHNQEQVMDCMALSQRMGFKRFEIVRDVRYPEQARHYQTGEIGRAHV